jgi:hypothetical protein
MRLTSEIWVSAFLRAEQASGAFATVLRRGAAQAGAIFVVHNRPDRTVSVYAPAPQAVFGLGESAERRFELVREAVSEAELRDYLDRQVAFDSDCWIVETQRRDPPNLFT